MDVAKKRLTDYEGLSAYLTIPKSTLRARVRNNSMPFIRLGPRLVRFDLDEIDGWLASNRGGAK